MLTVRDCRPQYEKALQQPLGLGRQHGSAPGGRRALRSAQRTRGLASCALFCGRSIPAIGRMSRGIAGKTGDHLCLKLVHLTGLTNRNVQVAWDSISDQGKK